MIPVLGFATISRFDLAERLLASIDYPVEHLVIIDNSGKQSWQPKKPEMVKNLWLIQVPFGLGLVGAWNLVIKSTPYAPYWLLVNDDAFFEPGSLEEIANGVDTEALNFVRISPEWSCVAFGEGCIEKVGLYDERFYPLYFDDNDFERRVRALGIPINRIDAGVGHNNSSSLAGFEEKNRKSFAANQKLFEQKAGQEDLSDGHWSLKTRRANRWD